MATLARAPRLALHLAAASDGATMLSLKAPSDSQVFTLGQDLLEEAAALLAAPTLPKTCHDLKTHIALLRRFRIDLHGVDFDTMLAAFLVNPGKTEPSLGDLYHQYLAPLGGDAAESSRGLEPALAETIRNLLAPRLAGDGLEPLFADIEIPVARVLAEMEAAGIGVDAGALAAISTEFGAEMERLEQECFTLAGHPFNLNSPIQLRDILFNELKLSAKGLKKTQERLLDRRRHPREARGGPCAAGAAARVPGPREAQIDLFRRAADPDRSGRRTPSHPISSGPGGNRPAQLDRSEFAEYTGPQ